MTDCTNHSAPPIEDCWNTKGVFSRTGRDCERLAEHTHCHNCPVFTNAARLLLDREIDPEYRRELTRIVAAGSDQIRVAKAALFAFQLGSEWLGLPVAVLREVMPSNPVHTVPHKSNEVFLGLISVRGKLELHFSLSSLLRIPADLQTHPTGKWTIVCEWQGFTASFPVDGVGGVLHYHDGMLCPLPVTLSQADRTFCTTLVRNDGIDYGLLDPQRLFSALEERLT